jgi:hypothetical protein
MKACYVCEKLKDLNKFKKDLSGKNGRANICKKCHSIECYEKRRANPEAIKNQYSRTQKWQDAHPDFKMFQAAKRRAKQLGLPFEITRKDVIIPEFCPVLGIPLIVGGQRYATANSPSLDRFIPELGYVPGNVMVISHKANTIKSNATAEEVLKVFKYMKAFKRKQ